MNSRATLKVIGNQTKDPWGSHEIRIQTYLWCCGDGVV